MSKWSNCIDCGAAGTTLRCARCAENVALRQDVIDLRRALVDMCSAFLPPDLPHAEKTLAHNAYAAAVKALKVLASTQDTGTTARVIAEDVERETAALFHVTLPA